VTEEHKNGEQESLNQLEKYNI